MYFQYDTSGTPFGFVLNGIQYFYMTNQMVMSLLLQKLTETFSVNILMMNGENCSA